MERRRSDVVYKYFDLTDEFLRIRVLDPDAGLESLGRGELPNKSAYRREILCNCVIGWEQSVLPRLRRAYPGDSDAAEDLLYQICVEVNPRFEIHQVSLPAGGAEPTAEPSPRAQSERVRSPERWLRRARNLRRKLEKRIVGQGPALERVCRCIRKHAAGLGREHGLVGSFLLVGNTGVGKTALAKALAETLFADPSKFVRIDCSEYSMAHEYSKLIGAPPGYVGHDEGGMLTDALQRVKESVVLFDEVEKAHPKVHQLLLQVLDEGHLTDAKGARASLADSLVLMTSNLGTRELIDAAESMGFGLGGRSLPAGERSGIVTRALRRNFAPEFLARIDEVLVFSDLDTADCEAIAALEVEKLRAKLVQRGLRLRVRREVIEWVAREGYSPRQGAREIARVLSREFEDPLAEQMVAKRPAAGSLAMLKLENDRPQVELRTRRW